MPFCAQVYEPEGEEKTKKRMSLPTPYPCSLRGPEEGRRQGGYSILEQKGVLSFVGILSPPFFPGAP